MNKIIYLLIFFFTISVTVSAETMQRINPDTLIDSTAWGFTQVVVTPSKGKTVYLSGQYGGDSQGSITGMTVEEQMTTAFKNLKAAIAASGAGPEHVVKITVLIVGHREKYLPQLARETQALFGDTLPASTLIPVPRLALDDMLFEIDATLFIPE